MKKKWSFLSVSLLIAAMSCTPKTAEVNQDVLIDSLLAEFSTAWNSNNPETIADYYTNDAIMITDGSKTSGRDSILSFGRQVAGNVKNLKASRGTYAVANGIITGTFLYTFDWIGPDQKVYPNRGSSIVYWQKNAENRWKATLHIYNQADVVQN